MKQRPRIYYSESQKALMWERWRKGDSLQQIAQLFDRHHSSVQRILAEMRRRWRSCWTRCPSSSPGGLRRLSSSSAAISRARGT